VLLVAAVVVHGVDFAIDDYASPDGLPIALVLLTGFGPFKNFTINPSGDVARLLNNTCTLAMPSSQPTIATSLTSSYLVCFHSVVLPVNHTGSGMVSGWLEESGGIAPWDAILHMGLEDVAKGLRVETAALNNLADDIPDDPRMERCMTNHTPFNPLGGCIVPVTVDLSDLSLPSHLIERLRSREFWSRDAGTYYCNETLYRTLHTIRNMRIKGRRHKQPSHRLAINSIVTSSLPSLIPAMFVHLPNEDVLSVQEDADVIVHLASQMVMPTMRPPACAE
jgi:hypothetical protein